MEVVPAAIAVATPDDEPMEATPALLLLQVPPATLPFNVVVEAKHTIVEPVIAGVGFTVICFVALQPAAVV
jgi:hypothetical protein